MKRITVIGGISKSQADVDEIADFASGVSRATNTIATVEWTSLDDLYFVLAPGDFRVHDQRNGHLLNDVNLVILRSKMRKYGTVAFALSKFCEQQGIEHLNDYSLYFNGTKLAQTVLFYELDVPFIKTVYALGHDVLLSAIKKELGFPCILKDAHGAHGNSNYLVHSHEEAKQILQNEPKVQFIAQEFCPNDRDYRVFITDEEHLVFARTGSDGSHLNNTSQGGQAMLANNVLPAEILADSHRIARAMRLSLAGVDVIQNIKTSAYYFLEINSQPQTFTGAFLEEKAAQYARFIRKRLGE